MEGLSPIRITAPKVIILFFVIFYMKVSRVLKVLQISRNINGNVTVNILLGSPFDGFAD